MLYIEIRLFYLHTEFEKFIFFSWNDFARSDYRLNTTKHKTNLAFTCFFLNN